MSTEPGFGRLLSMRQETVVLHVIKMMGFWGMTLDDLDREWRRCVQASERTLAEAHEQLRRQALVDNAAVVKYRHPKSGKTWNGFGRQPGWLRQALTVEGYRVSQLRPGAANTAMLRTANENEVRPARRIG